MPQQNPRPLPDRIAIGHPGSEYRGVEHPRALKEFAELGGARPIQRIDRIAVVGVAERHCHEDEPTPRQEVEAVACQLLWLEHVLEQIAAKQRVWPKRTQPLDI